MFNQILEFLKSKQAEKYYWEFANVLVGLTVAVLTEIDVVYIAFLVPLLNQVSKHINLNYIKK